MVQQQDPMDWISMLKSDGTDTKCMQHLYYVAPTSLMASKCVVTI